MLRSVGLSPAVLLFGIVAPAAGCKPSPPDEPPCYPVSGEFFYKGKPAKDALVTFRPLDGSSIGPWPRAYVDDEGKYKLTLRTLHDGATAGEYGITLLLRGPGKDGDVGANLLPAKYSLPNTTPHKFTVKPGDNVVPRIDVNP